MKSLVQECSGACYGGGPKINIFGGRGSEQMHWHSWVTLLVKVPQELVVL